MVRNEWLTVDKDGFGQVAAERVWMDRFTVTVAPASKRRRSPLRLGGRALIWSTSR